MNEPRLLIVGDPQDFHLGGHFRDAAEQLGIAVRVCDTRAAYNAPPIVRRLSWRVLGHRPPRLNAFSAEVVRACVRWQPTHLLATGLAPLTAEALTRISAQNIRTLNFLSDDAWNPSQRAEWFFNALPQYAAIFTPRHANINDLKAMRCARVQFLPFAYNPRVHFPAQSTPDPSLASDVLFAGGADDDRVPFLAALVRANFKVRLYGGYWEKYAETHSSAYGHADLNTLRCAVASAKVCLNLVRRANRDGHVMRTFEVPAMRGCLLTEDTLDHRTFFGDEGEAVMYFSTPADAVEQTQRLYNDAAERGRLADEAHARITQGGHTYAERLRVMLDE